MAYVMIWDPYERFLWGVAITIAVICGIQYINRGRDREVLNEKLIMYGIAVSLICLAMVRLFSYFADYELYGVLIGNTYYGDFSNYTPNYEIYARIQLIFFTFGFISIVLTFEIIVKRTKYIITLIYVILFISIIVLPFTLARDIFNFTIYPISITLLLFIVYLYTKWSRVEFKALSSFLILGIFLIGFGNSLGWRVWKSLNIFPLMLGPILFILGCLILLAPTWLNPERILRNTFYWKILASLILFSYCSLTLISFIFGLDVRFILYNIFTIITIFILFYFSLRNIKSEIYSKREEPHGETHPDVLSIFTKPQKVTEEEVSVSKEKKICLVCKGKVSRYEVYLCPDCEAIYCHKCARAVENLENACWVCEKPFDESKPVKKLEEKEEEITFEKK